MEPNNRVQCGDCKQFRTIEEYPFDRRSGYRASTCISCTSRQNDRRANDVLQMGQREKVAKDKQQRVKQSWDKMKEEFRSLLQDEEEAKTAWEAQMQFKWRNNIFWPPWSEKQEEAAKKNWDVQQAKVEERLMKEAWRRMRKEYRIVQTEEQAKRAWESQIKFQQSNDIFWPPWDERLEDEARAKWNARKEEQRLKEPWRKMREHYRSVQIEEQAKMAWESQIQFQAENNNIFWPPWDPRLEDLAKANWDALKATERRTKNAEQSGHLTRVALNPPAQEPAPVSHSVFVYQSGNYPEPVNQPRPIHNTDNQRSEDFPLQSPSEPHNPPPQNPYEPQDYDLPSPDFAESQDFPSLELSEPQVQGLQNE